MPLPTPEVAGTNIVLRGSFNPAIFQPAWLRHQNLISEGQLEAVNLQVVSPQVASYQWERTQVQVTPDLFQVTTDGGQIEDVLRDLTVGTFRVLRHTPISMVGINRDGHRRIACRPFARLPAAEISLACEGRGCRRYQGRVDRYCARCRPVRRRSHLAPDQNRLQRAQQRACDRDRHTNRLWSSKSRCRSSSVLDWRCQHRLHDSVDGDSGITVPTGTRCLRTGACPRTTDPVGDCARSIGLAHARDSSRGLVSCYERRAGIAVPKEICGRCPRADRDSAPARYHSRSTAQRRICAARRCS